jgi:hypothetical protein
VAIGSNSQPVNVQLDTGSSELWVDPDCSTADGTSAQSFCNAEPKYDSSTSTTAVDLLTTFSLSYGKGSASGDYFTDDMAFGSAKIKAQQFGVASTSSLMTVGILGVGPHTPDFNYPSVIETLATQKQTNSVAFSLDLRSVNDPSGM